MESEKKFIENATARVLELIDRTGKSAYPLESEIGISRGSIYNWRNKISYAKTYTLAKVADYFNVSLDYLVGREEKPTVIQKQPSTEQDIATVEHLKLWQQLDEIQRSKVNGVIEGMLMADIRDKAQKTN